MEKKVSTVPVESLLDLYGEVVDLVATLETANLRNAMLVRQLNSTLKKISDYRQLGKESAMILSGFLATSMTDRANITTEEMILNRASQEIIDGAKKVRELLRQAAFQAVLAEQIPEELKNRLLSQSRKLLSSFRELHHRYVYNDPH